MSNTFVISGLVTKRAELDGLMDHHLQEIQRISGDLKHIDATIKLFDPSYDLRSIRKRKHRKRNVYFKQGECARLVLDVLRAANTPLSTDSVAFEMMQRKKMDSDDPELIKFVKKAAITALGQQRANGLVKNGGLQPDGITLVWHLSQSPNRSNST